MNQMAKHRSGEQLDRLVEVIAGLRDLPRPGFKARLRADLERRMAMTATPGRAVSFIREGFHTVTPYLILSGAAPWIEFVKEAFGAEERFRMQRPEGGVIMHAEVKIGDSIVEVADANPQFPAMPTTLLLRASDPDAVYNRAIMAGATAFDPVADHDYGSRGGTVVDLAGNRLHISTPAPGNRIFDAFRSVTPHFSPARSERFIEFLEKAFGGEEVYRAQSPDGVIHHAQVRVGDSVISMGDAHGPYQPMPCTLHVYVPDADAVYEQALRAGATSIQPVADQPYGDRSGGVTDPFGNRWFIATHIRDVVG